MTSSGLWSPQDLWHLGVWGALVKNNKVVNKSLVYLGEQRCSSDQSKVSEDGEMLETQYFKARASLIPCLIEWGVKEKEGK